MARQNEARVERIMQACKHAEPEWMDFYDKEVRPVLEHEEDAPSPLVYPLLPNQKHSVAWMAKQELEGIGRGILADEAGLGKTLSILALITFYNDPRCKLESRGGGSAQKVEHIQTRLRTKIGALEESLGHGGTLVVCPDAVLSGWQTQIEKHLRKGTLEVLVLGEGGGKQPPPSPGELSAYDVILATFSWVRSCEKPNLCKGDAKGDGLGAYAQHNHAELREEFKGIFGLKWRRVVIDEGHMVQQKTSQIAFVISNVLRWTSNPPSVWVVTATPLGRQMTQIEALRDQFKLLTEMVPPADCEDEVEWYSDRMISHSKKDMEELKEIKVDPRDRELVELCEDDARNAQSASEACALESILKEYTGRTCGKNMLGDFYNDAESFCQSQMPDVFQIHHYRFKKDSYMEEAMKDVLWKMTRQGMVDADEASKKVEQLEEALTKPCPYDGNDNDDIKAPPGVFSLPPSFTCYECRKSCYVGLFTMCAERVCCACFKRRVDSGEGLQCALRCACGECKAGDVAKLHKRLNPHVEFTKTHTREEHGVKILKTCSLVEEHLKEGRGKVVVYSDNAAFSWYAMQELVKRGVVREDECRVTSSKGSGSGGRQMERAKIKPAEITASIREFQNRESQVKVLFIDDKCATGVDLSAGSLLIILTPVSNKAFEDQLTSRIYRIGQQEKHIRFVSLIAKGTFQEALPFRDQEHKLDSLCKFSNVCNKAAPAAAPLVEDRKPVKREGTPPRVADPASPLLPKGPPQSVSPPDAPPAYGLGGFPGRAEQAEQRVGAAGAAVGGVWPASTEHVCFLEVAGQARSKRKCASSFEDLVKKCRKLMGNAGEAGEQLEITQRVDGYEVDVEDDEEFQEAVVRARSKGEKGPVFVARYA